MIFSKIFSNKGFTLIELIMSMGLMSIIFAALTGIFGSIIDVSLDSRSYSGIDQDERYILARLSYDMQRSDSIVFPSIPSSGTETSLTLNINSVEYTYDLDGDGNMRLTNDTGINNLNSFNVEIRNLSFQRLGIGDVTDTIQVKFDLTSKINRNVGFESKSIQTTIGK